MREKRAKNPAPQVVGRKQKTLNKAGVASFAASRISTRHHAMKQRHVNVRSTEKPWVKEEETL
jgi:hypothetical protein